MSRRSRGEGSIIKRVGKRADGSSFKRWHARITSFYDGEEQRRRDGPRRKSEAEAKHDLKAMLEELERSGYQLQATIMLKDYLGNWLKRIQSGNKLRTYQTYEQDINNHVIPEIGHIKLKDLLRIHVQHMVDKAYQRARDNLAARKRTVKPGSGAAVARKCRATLRAALQDAVNLDIIPRNPCDGVRVPSEPLRRIAIWSDEEHARFLMTARSSRLFAIIYTALTSGMREGELCALRWDDLEVTESTLVIHIRHTLIYVTKRYREVAKAKGLTPLHGPYFLDRPKTHKSYGQVAVGLDTLAVLVAHQQALEEHRQRLGDKWHELGLVFPTSNGLPQDPSNLLRDYQVLIKKAGVPRLSFHDLRDTHASRALAAGVDISTVSERLRHSRRSTTLDRYAHALASNRQRGITMNELVSTYSPPTNSTEPAKDEQADSEISAEARK